MFSVQQRFAVHLVFPVEHRFAVHFVLAVRFDLAVHFDFAVGLWALVPLVGLLVEVEEEREEDGRVDQEESCHQFWVAAVEDQDLERMEENQGELSLNE